ncbi:hypothetical protein [Arsenicibacter rosenii]|uniref:CRISPR-associated protein Csh1 n=1 Tax=Arsenicibacter rosenii TaxID=1750698 RepID=A0A1S2VIW8_9BACT|nr:hypothetical protein [Arsenicibacter rosenii]OIN58185.1 hypothetical protein BLX24_16865 [Arsenicibacter rosenii]
MLKELSTFTQNLDADLKEIGVEPREGLHIVLSLEESPEGEIRIADQFEYTLYRKKKTDPNEKLLKQCAAWARAAWMVDTNKCLDLPGKKIHSASPFCLAYKFGSLLTDSQLEVYFNKAGKFLQDENGSQQAQAFRQTLNSWDKIQLLLSQVSEVNPPEDSDKELKSRALKEGEYIIFYLDTPLEVYLKPNALYLQDRLFNTSEYNAVVGEEIFGTSAFFNGFPLAKKPFYAHKTATFDIAGRISAGDALRLHEFSDLMSRNIFPRPLPIFIYNDELPDLDRIRKLSISIFKEEALKDSSKRKSHAEIIRELYEAAEKKQQELGNYYLLYYQQGQIKDFDFVSRFEYHLWDNYNKRDWLQIKNIMGVASTNKQPKIYPDLRDVFQLLHAVFTPIIGNKYLKVDNFFGDIDAKDYIINTAKPEQHLVMTKSAASTYRKAVYDYVYKSKRDAINHHSFWNMVVSTFSDDLKYERDYQLKEKLNILFSLNHFFDPENRNFNGLYMPDKLEQLITKTMQIADSPKRVPLEDEYEFAFIAGQMIDYLLSLSKTSDTSHAVLEGFLQKTDIDLFKQEIIRVFERYKHEVERPANLFKNRVSNLMREIMGYFPEKRIDLKKLQVFILAGYFSPSFIYTKKQTDSN